MMHIRAKDANMPPVGADAVPDSHGLNLYRADPGWRRCWRCTCRPSLLAHLAPHLDRLGALAGGRLDELAAHRRPQPARAAPPHPPRRGAQTIDNHPAYREMERIAFGEYGLAAMSHRAGVLGWPEPMPPAAKYALTYLFVQASSACCCPVVMTDTLTRTLRRFGDPALVARYLPGADRAATSTRCARARCS